MASQQQLSSREVEEKMFSPRKNLMPRRKGQPTQNVAAAAQSVVVGDLSAKDTLQRQQALDLLAQPEPQGLSKTEFKESITTTTTTQPLEFQQPTRRPLGHDFKPAAPAPQIVSEPCECESARVQGQSGGGMCVATGVVSTPASGAFVGAFSAR